MDGHWTRGGVTPSGYETPLAGLSGEDATLPSTPPVINTIRGSVRPSPLHDQYWDHVTS